MNSYKQRVVIIIFTYLIFVNFTVLAANGVVEINQTCATQLGCFSGDSTGFPISIDGSAGRSYILTSDLILTDENTTGININAVNVTIDLNGFEIVTSACQGATSDCTPVAGSGNGVYGASSSSGITIKNGTITGMGDSGVYLAGNQIKVSSMHVRWNRKHGVSARGFGVIVRDSFVVYNKDRGIDAGFNAMVTNNVVRYNITYGIYADRGSNIRNNISSNNTTGYYITQNSVVLGNTSTYNGGDGIVVNSGCNIRDNIINNNTGVGLNMSGTNGYGNNVITSNTGGDVTGGTDLGNNLCSGLGGACL